MQKWFSKTGKRRLPIDTESWNVVSKNDRSVTLQKDMHLTNYKGTELILTVDRTIKILDQQQIMDRFALSPDTAVRAVGYETDNQITNKGDKEWTEKTRHAMYLDAGYV